MAGKNRNYKKLSILKSIAFFILAAVIILYMRKDAGNSPEPTQQESTTAFIEQHTTAAQIGTVAPPKTTEAETTAPQKTTEAVTTAPARTEAETITPPQTTVAESTTSQPETESKISVTEDGEYSDKEHVALYIHTYGKLPSNYITKTKAKKQGWEATEGNLWKVLPGKSIGGGPFGNNEGSLPEKKGRTYTECDIDYDGGSRNAKRIVYSNDGLIYYTEDHYNTFELLYGEP